MRHFLRFFSCATVVAILLCGLCAVSGCKATERKNLFAYTEADFTAEAKGTLRGEPCAVVIYWNAEPDAAESRLTVRYQIPEALQGLTVSLYPDGHCEVRLGELQKEGDFRGLIYPFLAVCPVLPYKSIEKKGDETAVLFENGVSYHFDREDVLVGITGEYEGVQLDLRILLFKQIK